MLGQPAGERRDRGRGRRRRRRGTRRATPRSTSAPRARRPAPPTSTPPGRAEADLVGLTGAHELCGRALGEQATVVDDDDLVGQLLGLVEIVGRQQHRDALRRGARRWCAGSAGGRSGRCRPSARRGTRRRGRPISASASDRRCCSPPERLRHVVRALLRQAHPLQQLVRVGRIVVVGGEQAQHLERARRRCTRRPFCSMTPIERVRAAWSATGSRPSTRTVPSSARRKPSRVSTVDVLPAPFGPSRASDGPGRRRERQPSTAVVSP